MITENINGATSTFKFLCDDEVFQKGKLNQKQVMIQFYKKKFPKTNSPEK